MQAPDPTPKPLDHLALRGEPNAPALKTRDGLLDYSGLEAAVGVLAASLRARRLSRGSAQPAPWRVGCACCKVPRMGMIRDEFPNKVGEAEAIRSVYAAIHEGNPDAGLITIKYLEALVAMADGTATKIILPTELAGLAGAITGITEAISVNGSMTEGG